MIDLNPSVVDEINRYGSKYINSFYLLWNYLNELVGPIGSKRNVRYSGFYTDYRCKQLFCYVWFKKHFIQLAVRKCFVKMGIPDSDYYYDFLEWNGSQDLVGITFYSFSLDPELIATLCCCCQLRRNGTSPSYSNYLSKARNILLEKTVSEDLKAIHVDEKLEGGTKTGLHKYYERDTELRTQAIVIHGMNCMACGFNFESFYGQTGKDFIEVHHVKPLSQFEKSNVVNPEKDMMVVCSNCHSMIHRKQSESLSLDELKEMIT